MNSQTYHSISRVFHLGQRTLLNYLALEDKALRHLISSNKLGWTQMRDELWIQAEMMNLKDERRSRALEQDTKRCLYKTGPSTKKDYLCWTLKAGTVWYILSMREVYDIYTFGMYTFTDGVWGILHCVGCMTKKDSWLMPCQNIRHQWPKTATDGASWESVVDIGRHLATRIEVKTSDQNQTIPRHHFY